jgi:3-oxoacyl-[acyl-carrier-protein] synthase II
MRRALADGGADERDIGYVNAHGTGHARQRWVETAALKAVFGDGARRIPVSSTKSMHGHLLGAGGRARVRGLGPRRSRRTLPPTRTCACPIPSATSTTARGRARPRATRRLAMSNSFAFGGTNAVLLVRRPA